MIKDSELLREFAQNSSGEAFTELVRRNLSMVHSCALRRLGGDVQLAEDITQRVFTDLARKAPQLVGRESVAAWLFVAANLASAEVVRKERRRKARELEGARLQALLEDDSSQNAEDWNRLQGFLGELVCGLGVSDREALVLRFFSRLSYPELGAAQATTEEGARKRVERALEKLRVKLAKAGVVSSREALEAALAKAPEAAPDTVSAERVACIAIVDFGAAGAVGSWWSLAQLVTPRIATMIATSLFMAALVVWQHQKNEEMRAKVGIVHGEKETLRELKMENQRLTMIASEIQNPQRTIGSASSTYAGPTDGKLAPARSGAPLNIRVASSGSLMWEDEPVDLKEFLDRLVTLRGNDVGGERQVVVHGAPGSAFSATAYAVEQASKAGFKNIVVESRAAPAPSDAWILPMEVALRPSNRPPPMLPDASVNP